MKAAGMTAFLALLKSCTRRFGAWLYGSYCWMVFAVLLLSFGLLALLSGSEMRARHLARFFARRMFGLTKMPALAIGLERLPTGPHILLCNHTSFLDAIVLTALLPAAPGYAFVTRRQFFLQVLLWPFLASVRTLILKQNLPSHHTGNVELMRAALERGENLVIFPEGAFAPEPGLKRFHSGAFVVASQAAVPVVVAALRGARNAMPLGRWLPRRRALFLEIGTVLPAPEQSLDAIRSCMRTARAAMIPLTGEVPAQE